MLISASTSLCLLTSFLAISRTAVAGLTADWRSQSIYQVMTDRFARSNTSDTAECDTSKGLYCGGTWQGIIEKLEYIQGMGFTAIYISPVTENLPQLTRWGQAYHGYWPQDIYALNDNFGTQADLTALSKALHDRGMYFMVDIVVNDMGFAVPSTNQTEDNVDYSVFVPFNDQKYYHSFCNITNYSNYTDAQVCWLGDSYVALPDLDTESPEVTNIMGQWTKDLVANYSIDGLRIDAAKHVSNDYLKSVANASGVFSIGEVYEQNPDVFCPYQELVPSMTSYPNYFAMIDAMTTGNMSALPAMMNLTKQKCADTTALASFSENHDLPRIASFLQDRSILKTIIAWTILSDGIPMIYQGQEQAFAGNGTPFNREALWDSQYDTRNDLYIYTRLMNQIRKLAIKINSDYLDSQVTPIYTDENTIALRKGNNGRQIVTVLSNSGDNQSEFNLNIASTYSPGTTVMEITSCLQYNVSSNGDLVVQMGGGDPHIFFPFNLLNGSDVCGSAIPTTNTSSTSGSTSMMAGLQSNAYHSCITLVFAVVMAFFFS